MKNKPKIGNLMKKQTSLKWTKFVYSKLKEQKCYKIWKKSNPQNRNLQKTSKVQLKQAQNQATRKSIKKQAQIHRKTARLETLGSEQTIAGEDPGSVTKQSDRRSIVVLLECSESVTYFTAPGSLILNHLRRSNNNGNYSWKQPLSWGHNKQQTKRANTSQKALPAIKSRPLRVNLPARNTWL